MLAYFLLVHRYPNQFKRLFKAIYHADNQYVVHIDKSSSEEIHQDIHHFLSEYPNASLIESMDANWGGYSLVDAELRGMKMLLEKSDSWEFFINLSGQDFPLQSQENICQFLKKNKGRNFIKMSNQKDTRPETLHRIEKYVEESGRNITEVPSRNRPFMKDVTPYIGNQWMILCREFCEFVTHSDEIKKFRDFYRHSLIADEGFFQTVLMNTSYPPSVINDDKRAIDWIPMGDIKLKPRDFTSLDEKQLCSSKNLFARKFDETIDSDILTILEKHITMPQSFIPAKNII